MVDTLPSDRQPVEVKLEKGDWQPAVYRNGQFIDGYGLPLDLRRVASWRSAGAGSCDSARTGAPGAGDLHDRPRMAGRERTGR